MLQRPKVEGAGFCLRRPTYGHLYKFDQGDDGKAQAGEKAEFTWSKCAF
jgi:hypothetical protein